MEITTKRRDHIFPSQQSNIYYTCVWLSHSRVTLPHAHAVFETQISRFETWGVMWRNYYCKQTVNKQSMQIIGECDKGRFGILLRDHGKIFNVFTLDKIRGGLGFFSLAFIAIQIVPQIRRILC